MKERFYTYIGSKVHEAVVDFDLNHAVTRCDKSVDINQIRAQVRGEVQLQMDIITEQLNNNLCSMCFYDTIIQDVFFDAVGRCRNMASVSSARRYQKSRIVRTYLSPTYFYEYHLRE
jgi:hypothetical protein